MTESGDANDSGEKVPSSYFKGVLLAEKGGCAEVEAYPDFPFRLRGISGGVGSPDGVNPEYARAVFSFN